MRNWPDANPYSALLPYLDERAWLLPEVLARRRRRAGPAGRPGAAELRGFLGASGRALAEEILRRLRAPSALWHVAVRRRGPRLCGECLPGPPPGSGTAFLSRALQALAGGCVALAAEGPEAGPEARGPAIYWLRKGGQRRPPLELSAAPWPGPRESAAGGKGPPAAEARWTGTYFDRALAPPPQWVLEEGARFAGALGAAPPRGCVVMAYDSRRAHHCTFCPGLPPATGSRFTQRVRETIAGYDRAGSLPVLCVDREAQSSALALVEWRGAGSCRCGDTTRGASGPLGR